MSGEQEKEMLEGYMDGFDLDAPEPSQNRSHSYRHGFANGRDDKAGKPRASAAALREEADKAIRADLERVGAPRSPVEPLASSTGKE